ncbi:reverse transcriptase domain-containing protein [Tanacetum coccineum]
MPFGLKNAGATYQRLVDRAFQKQIGRNLKVYVDDLVIKSHTKEEIIRDIAETFKTLRQINMKLNKKKCTFGMQEGMFLGYKVNAEVLKVCPDKADAVLSLPSPGCLKDVQKLNGKLASLNRFLSKSAEKSLPFFKTLKKCTKKIDFQWTQEAEVAFKQMKKLIAELPMLTAPKEKEELIMYLAAAKETISAVLMTERGGKQLPVYFVSRALRRPEVNYTPMEKLILALLSASRRLKRFYHGSSSIDGFGVGLILTNLEGVEFTYAIRFRFEATNIEAEYEALIADLRIAEQMGVKNLQANVDSRLVANQVNGSYVAKESGKVKFLIVAVDYFTKWIEAKPVTTITGNQVKKFVWDNIVCRFGLPGEKVSDNGKQFRDNLFKDWCEKLCIRQCFASVKHQQANSLVERANRSLEEGIKARLDERSKDWIGELSHVLWAHRTMIKSSNEETPFSLTYGTEAVIPAEIGMPTLRTVELDLTKNDEALGINLDLIEEKREQAAIQEAKSKAKMEKYYNSKVRSTSFRPGEMVYRSNDASHAKDGGKLGPKWEGPYEVTESLGKGAYKLKDQKGNELPRTWNICNLKKCYIHEV